MQLHTHTQDAVVVVVARVRWAIESNQIISAPFFHFEYLPFRSSFKPPPPPYFFLFPSCNLQAHSTAQNRRKETLRAMPEARDRRSNPVDVAAVFARRRASILGVLSEDELDTLVFGSSPVAPTGSGRTTTTTTTPTRSGAGRGRGGISVFGAENSSPRGSGLRRGRARGNGGGSSRSVLPSWYPRTPLRDITAVVRAIERRRARLGENEGQQMGTPFPADQLLPDPSMPSDGASAITPKPALGVKLKTPGDKVPKILLEIANQAEGESGLTPQKKLLNSIDNVEKVVKEELQRLKRTPSAKKAEREKRVRTLMSMR